MLSPGFCSALPKQSSELASRMLPALTCATGGATPKTYFALSIVAWYSTASAFAGAAEDCAKAGSGRGGAKKNMGRERGTGILQTEKTKSSTLRERSQCATAPSPLRRQRGHASAMLLGEHEKRRRTRPSDRSLAPSATAILCAIGANKTLVGVTKWCADVAPVGALP